jgi:CRP-like cAMP-binding protein
MQGNPRVPGLLARTTPRRRHFAIAARRIATIVWGDTLTQVIAVSMDPLSLFRNEPSPLVVAAGMPIFREGDPADYMYVVLVGEVELEIQDRVVATLRRGEIFGEMALIDGKPRVATAVAHTDCRCARINEERFLQLVREQPEFSLLVMRVLAERLRWADGRLQMS